MLDAPPPAEARGPQNNEPSVDWTAIERSPAFRELTRGRRLFAGWGTLLVTGVAIAYLVAAYVAPDLAGEHVFGDMSLGFAGGVALIAVTMAVTAWYVWLSNTVWAPAEERVRRLALMGEEIAPAAHEGPAPIPNLDLPEAA